MMPPLPSRLIALGLFASGVICFGQQEVHPQPPTPLSPVEFFRTLLATNNAARDTFLASKSPEKRRIIELKLREYAAMAAEQREAKLRALQLRWYTVQLMQLDPAERARRLASLAESNRVVVKRQLGPFNILPPGLQQEVLSNPAVMVTLARGYESVPSKGAVLNMSDEERRAELRKQQLLSHFKDFFELSTTEQSRALSRLSDANRKQMEKTLSNLSNLSKEDREDAIEGFKRFAELSPLERATFLKTAERWRAMNERDRALWRKIVDRIQSPPVNLPMPDAAGSKPELPPSTLFGKTN